jgi:hypothetical protein
MSKHNTFMGCRCGHPKIFFFSFSVSAPSVPATALEEEEEEGGAGAEREERSFLSSKLYSSSVSQPV